MSGDGKPEVATTIDHETLASRYVQTRERGTVGIVTGGVDGIASTIHLGRECHIATTTQHEVEVVGVELEGREVQLINYRSTNPSCSRILNKGDSLNIHKT